MSDNETIADIVAEMREQADHATSGEMIIFRETWTSLADRLEAAWKREREAIYEMLDNSLKLQRINEDEKH